ncbi:hypothetical protein TIFTF001_028225 [Ficus carica]|uniref:Uncharacterized protein n=1 Tax=Ficus carica TaxID=3494 RepID=A0AA88DPM2_FICCA|nr:hypothetical protein TIFTF001_028225 [Ficus carica]
MLSGSSSGGSGDDGILDSLEPTASYADLGEAIKAAIDGLLLRVTC